MKRKELIHRLNRAQGQIEAIKRGLESDASPDCKNTIQLVKSANNALKKFAEAYVSEYMEECMAQNKPQNEMEKSIKEVISSAFSL